MDLAGFRAAYPVDFAAAPDALVTAKLADALAYCDARVFGTDVDQAHGLYAAHLLAIAQGGQPARLQSDKGTTTFMVQWQRLSRIHASGPWSAGQTP